MAKVIEVTDSKISSNEISSEITLDLDGVPLKVQDDVKEEVGDYLLEQILSTVGSQESPILDKPWPKLSEDYAEIKKNDGFDPVPNLERTGDMLGALDFKVTSDGIKIGIFGNKEQVAKADGHNNFSGESQIPTRQFLPEKGERFSSDIESQINKIILDAKAGGISKDEFEDVVTSKSLYNVLGSYLNTSSRAEIRLAVLRSDDLLTMLEDLDLIGLL
jgi:hypothetical protein